MTVADVNSPALDPSVSGSGGSGCSACSGSRAGEQHSSKESSLLPLSLLDLPALSFYPCLFMVLEK